MNKTILFSSLPLALALTACGEPMDGSDTADMAPDAVSADTGDADTEGTEYQPGEDGPLQSDVVPEDETMDSEGDDMAEEPAM